MITAVTTRPIDAETTTSWTLQGAKVVRARPVTPSDARLMADFVHRLSFGTRYFRFGRGDIRLSSEELAALCDPDPEVCRHFIAVTDENGAEIQIASARFFILAAGECCEMEILVADAWQGTQVAQRMMGTLLRGAKDCGLKRICARVLPTNTRMLRFARGYGFVVRSCTDHETIKTLCLVLDETDRSGTGPEG